MSSDVKKICRHCQHRNPESALACENCGRKFQTLPSHVAQPAVTPPAKSAKSPTKPGIMERFKRWLAGDPPQTTQPPPSSRTTQSHPQIAPKTNPTHTSVHAPTARLNENPSHDTQVAPQPYPEGQNVAGYYRNLKTIQLDTCNYYEVASLADLPSGMLNQPNPTHLIRETTTRLLSLHPQDYTHLSSREIPFILPQQQILPATNGNIHTLVAYPGSWGTLAKIKMPQSPEKALTWTKQVAQALMGLNQNGFGGFWPGKAGRETILIIGGEVRLADITFAQRFEGQQHMGDVYALASLLHYLLTGQEITPEAAQAPSQFRNLIRRAAGGGIATVAAFLQELENSKHMPVYERALRQSAGYLTHPGVVREHNEDYVGVFQLGLDQTGSAPPVGLYVVADGMGGQAAGEFASKGSVQKAFVQFINDQVLPDLQRSTRRLSEATAVTPLQQIENLVQVANQIVYEANQKAHTNRGSTITAALIIGKQAYIANVGDSRTYLLRQGQLRQITQDHSLVYSLYLAKQITEEEIYSHPRKNEVHRSIGDKAKVQVDTFSETLQAGDRLLLCSDGLWEMVRNPDLQQALTSIASPQATCDHLIRLANQNGGEDNITAIVVAIE